LAKNAKKQRFLAILAFFGRNAGKTRFLGLFSPKWAFSAILASRRRGFYINPWRALPRGRGPLCRALGTRDPRSRDLGIRGSRTSRVPGVPGTSARGGGALWGLPGSPGSPALWGFTSTPRAGAPRSRGTPSGVRKSRRGPTGSRETSPRSRGSPSRPGGEPRGSRRGCPLGGRGPRSCEAQGSPFGVGALTR